MANDNKEEILLTAGYCGLACKACSIYIASKIGGAALKKRADNAGMSTEEIRCMGCRSNKTSPYCTQCEIKKCIRNKELNWCSECTEYPCMRLQEFQVSLPHRLEVLSSLEFVKEHTLEEWDEEMRRLFTCEQCGTYNTVYSGGCPVCNNQMANLFSKTHWDIIAHSPERKYI